MTQPAFEVLLGFDMETDVGSWTPYYEGLKYGTSPILEILKNRDVEATFYFVGQAAKDVPESVIKCRDAGHEIGSHSLYHETVGDPIFPIPGITPLLPEEVYGRLALNTKWIEEVSGVRPRSFRAPRLFGSTAVCNALEKLEYVSDATYPMYFYEERLAPYHPSSKDWTQVGDLKLVQIPNFANLSRETKDRYRRDRDQWPIFRTQGADYLIKDIDEMLVWMGSRNQEVPVFAFYFHPWEFHPMPQGLISFGEGSVKPNEFIVKNCGDYALEQLDLLIAGIKERGGVCKTAAKIAKRYS